MANVKVLNIKILADIREFSNAMKDVTRQSKAIGKELQDIGRSLTYSVTLPVVAMGATIAKTAGDFEASMNRVGAVLQVAGDQFQELEDKAKDLGATTQFSASEVADAMEMLAKNGLNATQILGGTIDATLNLAAATGAQLATAADIATDVMLQFNKTAEDMQMVVDGITGTTIASKFSIDDYALALAQAGGVAGGLGVSFEDFNASIAATSALFASGSDAGTSFKTFLQRLVPQSKEAAGWIDRLGLEFFDANGNMKSMAQIAATLKKGLAGLNDETKNEALKDIFGTDAIRTAIGLANAGAEGIDRFAESIGKISAQEQAEARMKGFNGAMKEMASAWEALVLAVADSGVLDFFTDIVKGLANFFRELAKTNPEILRMVSILAGVAAAAGPVLYVLGSIGTSVIPTLIRGMGLLRAAFLTNPFGIIAAAVATAVYLIIQNWDKIVEYFTSGEGSGAFQKLQVIVSAAMKIITGIVEFAVLFIADIWEAVGGPILNYVKGLFQTIVDKIDVALGYVLALAENMLARLIGIWKFFKGLFTADWALMWEGLVDVVASFVNAITEGIRFMVKNVLGPIKTLADAVGLDGVSGAMTTALDSVDSFFNAIKIESKGAEQAADIVDKFTKSVIGARKETKKLYDESGDGPLEPVVPTMPEIKTRGIDKSDNKEAEKKRKEAMQAEELANLRAFTKAKQQIELDYANGIIKTEAEANMKKAEANITYRQANLDTAKKFNLKELEAKDEYEKAVFERDLLAAEQKKATEEAKRLAQKQLREDTISGGLQVLGALRNFAGQSKGLALFEIAVNTAIGLSRAIKAGAGLPFPTNIPAILSGTTAVLSGMTAAKNALSKAPAFAEGGAVMGGPTLSLLGDNPSGKEAIIPFEKMTEFASRMVGNVGGGVIQVVGEVKIAGRDMLLLIRNAERAEERGFA